ncbi:MAG TPA: hypothetical protein VGD59_15075 [Acidisarcina sp.]
MTEFKHTATGASSSPVRNAAIPSEQSLEIRRIAHDLSNALEIIIQTSYLVGTLDLDPSGRQWIEMLDSAVKQAVDLNSELRSYIQANSMSNAA